jgi:hypothetical protein
MKRLITFGDSFGQYAWPMWPEILAQGFDETINYSRPGCGNFYIFNSFIDYTHNTTISHEDTVIVQWTESLRHDYINFDWVCDGIGSAEKIYQHGLSEMISDVTVNLKTLTYMSVIANMLLHTGCKWKFLFLSDDGFLYKNTKIDAMRNIRERYERLSNFIKASKDHLIDDISMSRNFGEINMPMLECSTIDNGNPVTFLDSHPTPDYTYDYLNRYLIPGLNFSQDEKDNMKNFTAAASESLKKLAPNGKYSSVEVGKFFANFAVKNNFKSTKHLI